MLGVSFIFIPVKQQYVREFQVLLQVGGLWLVVFDVVINVDEDIEEVFCFLREGDSDEEGGLELLRFGEDK